MFCFVCLRFHLNILVVGELEWPQEAGSRAGLGSLGGRSLPPGLVLSVQQLQAPSLVGDGSALANRSKVEHPEHWANPFLSLAAREQYL